MTQLTSSSLLLSLAITSLSPAVLSFQGSDKLRVKLGSSATGTFYYIIYFLFFFFLCDVLKTFLKLVLYSSFLLLKLLSSSYKTPNAM